MQMEPTEAQDRIQGTWPIADHRVKRELEERDARMMQRQRDPLKPARLLLAECGEAPRPAGRCERRGRHHRRVARRVPTPAAVIMVVVARPVACADGRQQAAEARRHIRPFENHRAYITFTQEAADVLTWRAAKDLEDGGAVGRDRSAQPMRHWVTLQRQKCKRLASVVEWQRAAEREVGQELGAARTLHGEYWD